MDVEKILTRLMELGATWGLRVIGVLVALILAWILAHWLHKRIRNALEKKKFDKTLTRFFANLAKYAIIVGAVIGCLGVFGIQTASFAAAIAAAGLAIGLAFQGSLSNFASGVMLLIFRPFKVGDFVRLDGELGHVEEVDLFTTSIASLDHRRFVIPSSKIFGSKIENLSFYDKRRVDVPVGVEYPADLDETRKVFEKVVANIEHGLSDPEPQVYLWSLGDSAVTWQLRVWCEPQHYWGVREALVENAKKALDQAGIGIPFPQTDVHLDPEVVDAFAGKKAA
jgi:small conductance mechanosensitive channel